MNLARKQNINSLDLQVNQAILLMARYDYHNAELLLEGIIAKDPDHLSAYDNLIRIYKYLNRIEKTEIVLKRYLSNHPTHLPYLWDLGQMMVKQARHNELPAIKKAIKEIDPNSADLRDVYLIPSNYESIKQIDTYRLNADQILSTALKNNQYPIRPDKTFRSTPFYLSYHAALNHTLLRKLNRLMAKGID